MADVEAPAVAIDGISPMWKERERSSLVLSPPLEGHAGWAPQLPPDGNSASAKYHARRATTTLTTGGGEPQAPIKFSEGACSGLLTGFGCISGVACGTRGSKAGKRGGGVCPTWIFTQSIAALPPLPRSLSRCRHAVVVAALQAIKYGRSNRGAKEETAAAVVGGGLRWGLRD
jgi:hypothetical protein